MRFRHEEVMAVLRDAAYPMTTRTILKECNKRGGRDPYHGDIKDIRPLLDGLAEAGELVRAKCRSSRDEGPVNPYQFIARPEDRHGWWWMTKERAEGYREQLERQRARVSSARDVERLLRALEVVDLAAPFEVIADSVREIIAQDSADEAAAALIVFLRQRIRTDPARCAMLLATALMQRAREREA